MKKEKPKVSIIIPVYKVEPYIERCIKSVLGQTYRKLEVILVDDCSPDHSMEIAEKCIKESCNNDLEIKCLMHEHNGGLSAARNTGIEAAKGEYIFFIDSDDYIISECIELLVESADNYPDVEVIYVGAKTIGSNSLPLSIKNKTLPNYSEDRNWINRALLQGNVFHVMAWNKLVQRSFVMEHHLFFERVRHEDDVWNWEMAKHVQKIAVCKHDTYVYMIHDGGIMSELERDLPRMYLGRIAMLKYFVNHITDPFRKRQISCIRNYIRIVFPNNDDIEYKDELQYLYTRIN